MRGLRTDVGARTVIAGHAVAQNIRRGHYELAADAPLKLRGSVTFDELAPGGLTSDRSSGSV
jgi:hypothetical protein